ncbi:NHL repeat-containing protein [Pyxidicoccus xibeiensis]|uniref:hypothetical protein n=1 Tax=Pyxidicoccus xibeiensis TaxID=2906759 RepID=UPI00225E6E81|nr:hypothetical protein [Pyxidicoccus xibeiensis]
MTSRRRGALVAGLVALALGLAWVVTRTEGGDPTGAPPPSEALASGASGTGDGGVAAPRRSAPSAAGAGQSGLAARGEVLVDVTWGSGPSQLGRERPQEGNPEAPMSLALTPLGDIVVLDQVNGRLVTFSPDGEALGTMPLTQQTPQDVTVAKDGTLLVLDRLRDKTVALLDPETGALRGELPLEGAGIPETGGITGTFVDGDSVYVEREHGALVRIGDLSGRADPARPELPGRPGRDGRSYLLARIIEAPAGRLFVNAIDRQTGVRRYTREYRLGFPLLYILLLDTDRAGVIYLGVAGTLPKSPGAAPSEHGVMLLCLDALEGKVLGQTQLPLSTMPEETFRDFAVLDEGGVIYQYRTEAGVSLRRADCR